MTSVLLPGVLPDRSILGTMVVAGYCDQAALYDTKRRTWASTPPPSELVGPLAALDDGTVSSGRTKARGSSG